jgi:carboxypeptidase Taq
MKDTSALSSISGLLAWDQETKMPPRGVTARAEQSAMIASVIHERAVDPKFGDLLRKLSDNAGRLTPSQRANVRERLRDYEKSIKLPPKLVRELARICSLSEHAWIDAKKTADFKKFSPWLKKLVDLKRQEAKAYGYADIPYDALLDDYEPAMTAAQLDPLVNDVRKGLVPIVQAITDSGIKIKRAGLKGRYPREPQKELCLHIMKLMGVDLGGSRLDVSAHPFCVGISPPFDVRITIKYDDIYLPNTISHVIHESGHALYEQGLPERHHGTPLGEAVSLGIHESQSRLWEIVIGGSRPFVSFLFPLLKKRFPSALKGMRAEQYYRAINRTEHGPVRIEADEVTYNLHIVVRYELEKALLAGDIEVKDLPGLWNEKYKKYLGVTPKNDAEGVLQDTHWPSGLFGYFPTYLLGNLYADQFWHKLKGDIRGTTSMIERGNFKSILSWLREKIHRHGRRYTSAQLVKRATGRNLSAAYFLERLKRKYGEIYRITW